MDYILKTNTPKESPKKNDKRSFYADQCHEEFEFWSYAKRNLPLMAYQALKKEDQKDLFRDQHTKEFWVLRLDDLKKSLAQKEEIKKVAETAKRSFFGFAKANLSSEEYRTLWQNEGPLERSAESWRIEQQNLVDELQREKAERDALALKTKQEAEEQARHAREAQQQNPHQNPSELWNNAHSVSDVIVCLSRRFSYLPENPILTEAQLRYALRDKCDIVIYRFGLNALHGHCYRKALIAMQGAGVVGRPVSYCSVDPADEILAKTIYIEYKAYLVLNGIHTMEQAFREDIIVDQTAFMKSLMDTNPKSADEVSTLKGLSSHYQDAWAQVNEALKDLPEE
jgi:hypothetical protein